MELLRYDLEPAEHGVRCAVKVPLSQQQFDALVIFAFNIGVTGLRGSSAIKLINDPQYVAIYPTLEAAWKAWNKSQGKLNQGLVNRRNCEWKIWQEGTYERW